MISSSNINESIPGNKTWPNRISRAPNQTTLKRRPQLKVEFICHQFLGSKRNNPLPMQILRRFATNRFIKASGLKLSYRSSNRIQCLCPSNKINNNQLSWPVRKKRHLGIGVLKATKNLKYSESKFHWYYLHIYLLSICEHRGGIAVVWLGKKNDKLVAMKQFPKVKGKSVD